MFVFTLTKLMSKMCLKASKVRHYPANISE